MAGSQHRPAREQGAKRDVPEIAMMCVHHAAAGSGGGGGCWEAGRGTP